MIPTSLASFIVGKPKDNWRSWGDPDSPVLKVLRFADQEEQQAAFAGAGIVASEGQTLPPDLSWPGIGDISVIGRVVDQPAVMGPEDESGFPTVVHEATYLPGWYVNVLVPEPANGEPTPSAPPEPVGPPTLAAVQAAIERHVDAIAAPRNYSSAVSLASYVTSTVPIWQAEAQAFVAWRDAVWVYALAELAKVQGGERVAPATTADFVAELPAIEWPEAQAIDA